MHSVATTEKMQTLVVGLGATGLSVARFLARQGIHFAVADSRTMPPGLEQLRTEQPGVACHLGPFDGALFSRFEQLVVSPGVPLGEPAIRQAAAAGARITGDIALFRAQTEGALVAVTGSNGKSTVTTLIGEMARRAGCRVVVGGNLGTPALELLEQGAAEVVVLELSSFQLELVEQLDAEVALLLNLSEDHMDRYADLASYRAAKRRIFNGVRQVVTNSDDPETGVDGATVRRWSYRLRRPASAQEFGLIEQGGRRYLAQGDEPWVATDALKLRGLHNHGNMLAALAAGSAIGLPRAAMVEALLEFGGLPHRCQWIDRIDGVDYVDDSKATNVGATVAAIRGLAADLAGKLVLILGGVGKGADFSGLREPVRNHARAVVLMGVDGGEIAAALDPVTPSVQVQGIDEAVRQARDLAQTGDCVLLAPACASFDQFSGFAERGAAFQRAVRELAACH
ncbi:MAG TPA: UDP-N-acetylmuramoyl-L-alanine--D-glutamate ligase [Pseudomonadales bacterium]|nr:UDP-N-acetylmuramoyl-L-alanine--D-glutamate ligase [Pseudomonadales bacterium]HNF08885.1 UDP-N-acetylmuramoyl-L-alanine--D-glutamate ligase [Pseudomonadales bacterium]HNN65150.1 UDP-N-acetylmuramoyl-L-alanine--D-glutamate ligase [Pseudomonadales bacterium]